MSGSRRAEIRRESKSSSQRVRPLTTPDNQRASTVIS
jgi:hypothetical protein